MTKKKDFNNLYQKRKLVANQFLVIWYCKNSKSGLRLAISINKKVEKKAVRRNLIKRQIKSILRSCDKLPTDLDLMIFPKKNFFDQKFSLKRDKVDQLFKRLIAIT